MAAETRLYFDVYWGESRTDTRSFGPEDGPVRAQESDDAALPLWGTDLPPEGFELARPGLSGYELFVPPEAEAELCEGGGRTPVPASPVRLTAAQTLRIRMRDRTVVVSIRPPPVRPPRTFKHAVLPLLTLAAIFSIPISFWLMKHTETDSRRVAATALWRSLHEGPPDIVRPGDALAQDAQQLEASRPAP